MKFIIKIIILLTFVSAASVNCLAQKIDDRKEDSGTYDIIDKNTLEIQTDFGLDMNKVNEKRGGVNLNTNVVYATLPSLTISYGLSEKIEISFFTGFFAVNTKGDLKASNLKPGTFKIDKGVSGISPTGFGFKYGLISEKKLRPSMDIESRFTMPFLGNKLLRPDKVGVELTLSFQNTFSDFFDLSYEVGNIWYGYDLFPEPEQKYSINPGFTFNDNISSNIDLSGYLSSNYSPFTMVTLGFDYDFNDYISTELSGGVSFYQSDKYYSIGLSGTFTIDFNRKHKKK